MVDGQNQQDGADILVDVTIQPDSLPVIADFTAATVTFDLNRGGV